MMVSVWKKILFLQFMHVKSNTKRNVRVKVDEIYFISQPKIFWLFNQYTLKTQRKIVRYWGTSKQQPTSTFTDCNLWNFASGRGLSSSTNPKEKTNGTKELKSRTLSLSLFFSLGNINWCTIGSKCLPKNLHSKIVAFGTHLG